MPKKKKQSYSSQNRRRWIGYGNNVHYKRVPIPSEVYEHVKKEMWYLSLDELKNELGVSKRVARALRDGKQMTISENYLSILRSIVGLDRRYGRRARIKWAIEESRDRKRYVALNRFLAKMIAELPPDVAKLTGGGWITKRANFWQASSEWRDQIFVLQILSALKKWYKMVHECYPEFDSVLFEGTGLFKDKPAVRTENGSNDQAAIPAQRPRRKPSSSRKSYVAMQKGAWDMARFLLKQFPPRPSSISKHK